VSQKGKGFAVWSNVMDLPAARKHTDKPTGTGAPGAIGATTSPGRVLKGLRMAGHMGHEQLPESLKIYKIDPEHISCWFRSVPGAKNGLLLISKSTKRK